jgi:iron complex outermembrane receptor protein
MEYTDDEFGIYPWSQSPGNTTLAMPVEALGTVISPAAAFISGYAGDVPDAKNLRVRISPDPKTGVDYPGTTREIFRASLILDWEVEWGTVSWLAAYADTSTTLFNENTRQGDVNTLGFFTVIDYSNDMSMWSQELRLTSNQEQSLRWMVGVNLWDEDVHQDQGGFACISLPFLPCGPFIANLDPFPARTFDRQESSTSVYGAIEFDINDQLTLSLEGRFFWEDQDVAGPDGARVLDPLGLFGPPPPIGPIPTTQFGPLGTNYGSSSDNYFTPRATLEYQRDDDTMMYFSIAQGGKPAGISTTGAGAGPFNPDTFGFEQETVWVYELGTKTTLMDGRLVANGAIYYQDFSDKQATSQVVLENGLLGTKTVNASDAEVTGLEIDLNYAITDNLTGTLGYSYIDATYGSFIVSTGGPAPIAQVGNCTPVVLAGSTLCNVDRSGNRMEDSSKHHMVAGLSMSGALADGNSWLVEADLTYTSDRFDTADNILKLDSYWMANLRGGVVGDSWEVVGYVDNVFNDDTIKTAYLSTDFSTIAVIPFPPPFTFVLANGMQARMPDPRQVGVRATLRF